MGHVMVAVPEGHTVQVHPPGVMPGMAPSGPGMIPDMPQQGALQALTNALPSPSANEDQKSPKPKTKQGKTEVKKPKSKVNARSTEQKPGKGKK